MKKAFLIIVILFAAANSFSQSTVYVKGYTKSNGSYIQGHYKTSPNSSKVDNYSTQGNYNPYTGSYGTKPVQEYRPTSTYSNSNSPQSNYSSSKSYTTPVYSGPRGGTYYINSNGNKTYIQ
jgi:hypothetical protein